MRFPRRNKADKAKFLTRRLSARRDMGKKGRLRPEELESRTLLSVVTWDGAPDAGGSSANFNWGTAANWVGDVKPVAGDVLVFPSGVPSGRLAAVNDFGAQTQFGSILVSGSGYALSGNPVALQSGLQATGGNATVSTPLKLLADQAISATSGTLTLNAAVDTNGFTLTLDAAPGAQVLMQQAISGSGGLVKSGSGAAVLAAANSYAGATAVNAGTLSIKDAAALGAAGTAANGTAVNQGGILQLDGSFTVANELLTLNGGGTLAQGTGSGAWAGNLSLGTPANNYLYFNVASGATLRLAGNVAYAGPYTYTGYVYVYGGGTLVVAGAFDLRYNGNSGYNYFYQVDSGTTLEVDGSLTGYIPNASPPYSTGRCGGRGRSTR